MTVTYQPETDAGYVRLLIADTCSEIFDDGEINAALAHENGPKRAAARLLLTIAASEALLSKKITTQDLSTDGPAVAEALRKLAAQLRQEADQDDQTAEWGMEIVPPATNRCGPELAKGWSW